MSVVKVAVLKSIQEVLDEKNIKDTVELSWECTRENGIDSLSIVSIILAIEEELDCELDGALAEIRKSKTIEEIIKAVEKEIGE